MKRIKDYFLQKQNIILILLSLGVILLLVRDVPFLNIFFPQGSILAATFITATILFNWYKNYIFFLILTVLMVVLSLTRSVSQAEQLAIVTFVILFILIVDQTISLFKDESK